MARSVEAPLAFFQEPVKAAFREAVEASQMPLRLVPKVLNAIDMVTAFRHKSLAVIDALVMELRNIQHIVHLKAIGVDDAVRCHFLSNDGDQGLGFGIRDDRCVHLTASR